MTTLQEQIKLVAEARRKHSALREIHKALQVAFEDEHVAEIRALQQASRARDDAEDILRKMTLAAYRETGNKHPAPGVDVRLVGVIYPGAAGHHPVPQAIIAGNLDKVLGAQNEAP